MRDNNISLLELDKIRISVVDKIQKGDFHNKDFTKNVLKKVEDLMVNESVDYLIKNGELHPDSNKIKNWKKPLTKSINKNCEIEERESSFRKQVYFFAKANHKETDFPYSEIENFISYWTEKNKSNTKMKWEMQQTFQINRRLLTWKRNYENKKKKKKFVPFESKFRKTVTNLYVAYCSRCGKKEMPNNKWQLKDGSSCCHVEYLPERINL